MSYIAGHRNFRLCSRNEGKIKSYESCRDVRAWSHDVGTRDRYLREWIKCDMPICVLPTSTLARFMRTMTYSSRGRATPRCHPDCKSKVVLESICNSCHVIKDCLKNEDDFEKYFDDEEFETSHWPCERCLDALKSIKMFWKIIVEKIFNVNMPKDEDLSQSHSCDTDSVRSVAKIWQTQMIQQVMFFKSFSPFLNRCCRSRTSCPNPIKKTTLPCEPKPCVYPDLSRSNFTRSEGKTDCKKVVIIKACKAKSTDTDCLSSPIVCKNNRKQSRHCTAKVKMLDMGCDCPGSYEEINAYKTNLEILQEKCNCQKKEIEKLKRENSSLRIELQNNYKNTSWKSAFLTSSTCPSNHDTIAILPKPFECCADEMVDTNKVKGIGSEMIITMKNCKNETYKHISLLQVLHKTNDPDMRELNLGSSCNNRREDPIELLTKVQNTFGAIVKREMGIANDKKQREIKTFIDATFNKVNSSRSAPSCSTITQSSSESCQDCRLTRES